MTQRLVLACVTFMAAAGCATTPETPTTPEEEERGYEADDSDYDEGSDSTASAPTMQELTAPEGFSVLLPGQPEPVRQKVTIPAGEVATAAWSVQTIEGVIWSISIADYPEKVVAARPASAFLNEGRDGLANQLKGTVKDEQALTLQGYPGKAYRVTSDYGEVQARNFLVGPRLYTMLVLYNPSIGAPGWDTFMTSLKLINPPPSISNEAPN